MLRKGLFALPLILLSASMAQESRDLDSFLKELEQFGKENRRLNVPPEHGRFLWTVTELTGANRALEIGTSNGYSSLWIGRGLRNTGGKLDTIEIDKDRGTEARENFKKAGFDDILTVHIGDAFKVIPTLEGKFDLIFLDAWKPDYKKFFDLTIDRLNPGGVFIAHNVVASAKDMSDFLEAIDKHPQLITSIVQLGRDGFSVSLKKRANDQKKPASQ
jgi:caffeoyl-CoA O-methyltransferase